MLKILHEASLPKKNMIVSTNLRSPITKLVGSPLTTNEKRNLFVQL